VRLQAGSRQLLCQYELDAMSEILVGTGRFELPMVRLRLTPLAGETRHSLARMRLGCFVDRPEALCYFEQLRKN
jgi:hypothetical protein